MFSVIPCSLSPSVSRIHSSLFSDWRRTVSSKFFNTQVASISTEKLVLPRHARCNLLVSASTDTAYCLFRIGRIIKRTNNSYLINILSEPNMSINLASTIKLLIFLANDNGKFFLFGNLMFFGVGNTMKVVKNRAFAPLFAHFNNVEFFGPK